MKPLVALLLTGLFLGATIRAQTSTEPSADEFIHSKENIAETQWPGVVFSVLDIQRISADRLLVQFIIRATKDAPANGTLIGIPVPIPKDMPAIMVEQGLFHPKPYSFDTSTMTEDKTKTVYQVLPPDPHPTLYYPPDQILATLRPGNARTGSMQFPIPPPDPDHPMARQTVSILFTNAVAPIAHLPLPPPENPAATH